MARKQTESVTAASTVDGAMMSTNEYAVEKRTRTTPKSWATAHGYGDYYPMLKAGDIAAVAEHIRLGSSADAQTEWDAATARAESIVSAARLRKEQAEAAEKKAATVLEKLAALKATAEK